MYCIAILNVLPIQTILKSKRQYRNINQYRRVIMETYNILSGIADVFAMPMCLIHADCGYDLQVKGGE